MAVSIHPYRWTLDEFVRAWEAGYIGEHTELLDGEAWEVTIGDWHGDTTMQIGRVLPNGRFQVTSASLASGQSIPQPDCWVRRRAARRVARLSPRMSRWAPDDVVLVVEVSDETLEYDLGRKAVIYAEAGYADYWVVSMEGVYAHSVPGPSGYRRRTFHPRGTTVQVPYCEGIDLAVDDLVAEADDGS